MTYRSNIFTTLSVIFWTIATITPALSNEPLSILTEDYPPLNYVDNSTPVGPSVDIVNAIIHKLKLKDKIKVYPWARGYNIVQSQKNTLLFSMTRSEQRENMFKWVGPLAEKKIGLFAIKGSEYDLKSLDDAKQYSIGVQHSGVGMEELISRGFKNIQTASTAAKNLKKLQGGRFDLWYSSNATVSANCKKLNIDPCDIEPVLIVKNTFMYIAFSKQTADKIVHAWQSAFNDLYNRGIVKSILEKHGFASLFPTHN